MANMLRRVLALSSYKGKKKKKMKKKKKKKKK